MRDCRRKEGSSRRWREEEQGRGGGSGEEFNVEERNGGGEGEERVWSKGRRKGEEI